MNKRSFTVILPAAGNSTRFALGDKLLVQIQGLSILQRSVELFTSRNDVAVVVIATAPDRIPIYRDHLQSILHNKPLHIVPGGRERWESVQKALNSGYVTTDFVAVHDAARPLTPTMVIDEAFSAAITHDAALPLLPEPATLKRMDDSQWVQSTVSRAGLYQAQTPQCFHTAVLREAFAMAHQSGQLATVTDDAQVVELSGKKVKASPGSPLNIKITIVEDITLAGAILQFLRSNRPCPKSGQSDSTAKHQGTAP